MPAHARASLLCAGFLPTTFHMTTSLVALLALLAWPGVPTVCSAVKQQLGGGAAVPVPRQMLGWSMPAKGTPGHGIKKHTPHHTHWRSFGRKLQAPAGAPEQTTQQAYSQTSPRDWLSALRNAPKQPQRLLQQSVGQADALVQEAVNGVPQSAQSQQQLQPVTTWTGQGFLLPAPQPMEASPSPAAVLVLPVPTGSFIPVVLPAGQHSQKLYGEDPVALHNGYRSVHQNTGPLSRDTQLEAAAQSWANKLAAECSFYQPGLGTNIASGFDSWSDVLWAFYKEHQSYSYSRPGWSQLTGPFTQMIWRDTSSVGCGVAAYSPACGMGKVHVCHYSPAGNVNDAQHFQQNVLPPK